VEPLDRATIWPYRLAEPGELYYQRYAHPNGVAADIRITRSARLEQRGQDQRRAA